MDYAAGQTTNFGAHHIDIAQWALGHDETGPVFFEGHGEFPTSGLFTVPTTVDFRCRYADGVTMRVRNRVGVGDGAVRFYGEKGWLDVSRRMVKAEHPEVLKETIGENEIQLYRSRHHMGNFLECIRTRKAPVSDIAIGHRSTTICNVGMIAMQLSRPLEWDPVKEEFANDVAANRMLGRAMRGPWSLA
jgi:predicted dehydrogenase